MQPVAFSSSLVRFHEWRTQTGLIGMAFLYRGCYCVRYGEFEIWNNVRALFESFDLTF